ncbi:putative Zinc-ribbon domain containing protein [Leishmania shawi]|uniref:Zinc-ribbon domain containing protein n=1 Tax=Leishmania shawi TaxID=5680 RepID=A0AAW3BUQ2_9TRYP
MRRTRWSFDTGAAAASAAGRALLQPRRTGKLDAQADTTSPVRRCSTTDANTADDGATAPSAATRPVHSLRLAVVRPDVLDDWVPELNDVAAQQISCDEATTLVVWRCSRCQKRYQCTVQARVARGRAACPHCGGSSSTSGEASASNSAAALATSRVEVRETLDKTHPDLAALWDVARNGALLPSHVTASSTRPVWWLPAARTALLPSSAAQRSFLRPVFACVYDSASPEEQAAATAAMEWRLLHEIRRVAHIEEAEKAGAIPVTLCGNQVGTPRAAAWLTGSGSAVAEASRPSLATMTAVDVHVVERMWKDRMSRLSMPENVADGTSPQIPAPRLAGALSRELFAHSPTSVRRSATSDATAAASTVREALLGRYFEFVCRQRRGNSSIKEQKPFTPVLASLSQLSSAAAATASSAAKSISPSWTDFFTLTRDSALPKGYIDPNAALHFPGAAEAAAHNVAATAASEVEKVDSLRLTPSQMHPTVLTKYPRRPPSPHLREDDVLQTTPPMMRTGADAVEGSDSGNKKASAPHQVKYRQLMHHVHMPFGHAATAEEESAAKLAAEYDVDDDDIGRGNGSGPAHTADNAATFATELRGARGASDTTTHGAGKHRGRAATTASLIESAIAALGEAFSTAEAGSSSNQRYHREAHRTAALSDELMASCSEVARRTSTRPRRFRLSLPDEAPQRRQWNVVSKSIDADNSGAAQPDHFDAPQAPRKVARPRQAKKETPSATAQ